MRKHRWMVIAMGALLSVGVVLAACTRQPTATPISMWPTASPIPQRETLPTSVPQATDTPRPASVPTVLPTPTFPLPTTLEVEPTCTARSDETRLSVGDLPIGKPGHYVNLTYGYWLQYPPSWYTHFGNRPLLASFSNLDPGTHNRESMRDQGCLIEVNATPNIFGFNLSEIRAQIPKAFPNAEAFELNGEPALRVQRTGGEAAFDSELVYVQHGDRLFTISAEYSTEATETCRPAWGEMLRTWQWFEPESALYRNTHYGYSISFPRRWYQFNEREMGLWISSLNPKTVTDSAELMQQGLLVMTNVLENPQGLDLREWVAAKDWDVRLANDIPLDTLLGLRVIRRAPVEGVERMSGYFQGPLGRMYEVSCFYPEARRWEFRPMANAIIYSFSF